MPVLLTFGDSNTHGTPPIVNVGEYHRFGRTVRWPGIVRSALPDWEVVEEGLPGRTAQFDDVCMGSHMNGQDGLKTALESHGPIDVLTIMLGTNDVKTRFGVTAEGVTGGIASLLDIAQDLVMQTRHGGFRILLICPPPVLEQGPIAGQFFGASERSRALSLLYDGLARARGCGFLDAGRVIAVSPVDGVHFDEAAHAALGAAVAEAVLELIAEV